jgi:hypothetical protein
VTTTDDPARAAHPLAWYVAELIARLGEGDPSALDRVRTLVGTRRARIGLERDVVETWFDPHGVLVVDDVTDRPVSEPDRGVDGEGSTRDAVVVALLGGRLEVTDAILDGDLEVRGSVDAVAAMFAAVDILIDCGTRLPRLRELSEWYLREHSDPAPTRSLRRRRATAWPPQLVDSDEDELLERLGLHSPPPFI